MKFFKSKDCPNCPAAERNLDELVEELKIKEPIEKYDISTDDGQITALENMVAGTPALVIGEELYDASAMLDKKRLRQALSTLK